MWAFSCGVVSAGQAMSGRWSLVPVGLALTGPLVCGTSQAVNDWFDRHVDAINEPGRPIPSGRIPGRWGLGLAVAGTMVSLGVGLALGWAALGATALALLAAWAYSAPPARLKLNGWYGNTAVGFSYEGLAWVTGAALALGGALPPPTILAVAALYSLGAHGIMTLNDYKAIEGDRRMGIRSLPATLGPTRAGWVLCTVMVAPQLVVIGLLLAWGATWHPYAVAGLVAVQLGLMWRFLRAPVARALFLSAIGVPFYVWGMMVSAFALRSLPS